MRYKILLFAILLIAFFLRLYRFDNPIGDWHAFRQADTSAVSKVFVSEGFHIFTPTYFDISNIQSGKDNPNGYRMVEFPIFNTFQTGGFLLFSFFSLEQWGRIISIFSSLVTIIFLYLLVKKYSSVQAALFSAFFYAVLPFSVYYGRVILPDPSATMTILGGIYFFDKAISEKQIHLGFLFISTVFTAISLLLKPFAVFFVLPMLYIAWTTFGFSLLKKWHLYIFTIFSIAPLLVWRVWISQFPEGIPASNWLFNGGNIRFTGAYFYWIFADRIGKLILGYTGYTLLFLGFIKRNAEKHLGFFMTCAFSSLLYLVVVARGNVQHDYYQIFIIPFICMFIGRGMTFLFSLVSSSFKHITYNAIIIFGLGICIVFSSIFFSWYYVRDYFNINNTGLIEAGIEADSVLPKDAKVIAANNGDTSFLYYINRKGWSAYEHSPEELAQMGATHIVIPGPTEADYEGLGATFKTFYSSEKVLILSLK